MLDADGNGYISEREAGDNRRVRDDWQTLDRNADGRLDRAEFSMFETGHRGGSGSQREPNPVR